MDQAWNQIDGNWESGLMLIGDHASAHVPPDIDLGIDAVLLTNHIAIDLGVAELAAALNQLLAMPAILGGISRLVVDLNREANAPHIIPIASDGHAVPGNAIPHNEREARIARFWHPYHDHIEQMIAIYRPKLLISLHSFTPRLATQPEEERPWEVGILYNQDERAARIAIPMLKTAGVIVGDQLPYSGKILNATMNRHGEGTGTAYLGIEMRQDLIANPGDVEKWAKILAPVFKTCRDELS
jgi:predicted N-formylglutamate amidohydrolase